MMLLAMIWVVIAPVSLLLPIWALYKGLVALAVPERWFVRWMPDRWRTLRVGLATVLVVCPVALIWYMDHQAFAQVCQQYGKPVIYRTTQTDGFFLDDGTANSFGMRYLQTDGFAWMEARSIYQRDAFVRYSRAADGHITETPQATQTARYIVVGSSEQPYTHTSVMRTRIIDTQASAGAQELAHAAMVHFNGGRLHWVLGIYGSDSYPSVMTDSATWRAAYDLVRNTLNPAASAQSTRSN